MAGTPSKSRYQDRRLNRKVKRVRPELEPQENQENLKRKFEETVIRPPFHLLRGSVPLRH